MNFLKQLTPILLVAGLLVSTLIQLSGQTVRGVLTGTVTDPSGAVVAGAGVVAIETRTGVKSSTVTSSSGTYRFPELPLGIYAVEVTQPGFKKATVNNVLVQVNTTTPVDVRMEVGESSSTVTVSAESQGVETGSSDIGNVVAERQIVELPLALGGVGNLRSPEAFVFLIPGTTGPGTANSANGIFISKVGGGQNFGNEIMVDGASQTRSENGSSFDEEAPSVEALQEFKVQTSNFPAEYGRTTGGVENFVTKSGTNGYHGSVYELFRNDALDANRWFNNGRRALCAPGDAACRRLFGVSPDKKNDYGVTIGGPVRIPLLYNGKNRTFFFFSWEQYRQTAGGSNTTTVPTLAERNGDFSARLNTTSVLGTNPCDGTPIYAGQIFDPTTEKIVNGVPCRSAFPANKINPTRFSAVAQNLLGFVPTPTNNGLLNNYSFNGSYPIINSTWTIRVDENFSEKSKLFFSYSWRDNTSRKATQTYPQPIEDNQWDQKFLTYLYRGGWDYAFSPTLLNHFNVGFNRTNSLNYTVAAEAKTDWANKLGIKNAPSTLVGSPFKPFPRFNIGEGVAPFGKNQADDNVDNGLRLNDSVSWSHGAHNFKFGVDYRYQQYSNIAYDNVSGIFNFVRGGTAAVPSLNAQTGNGIASLLLGAVNSTDIGTRAHQPRWLSHYYALFAQDDFKATRKLTLNLGLRWDVDAPRHEANNNTSNLDLTVPDVTAGNLPGALVFGTQCHCNTAWANTYYKDFGPRIGFAYSPFDNNRTAIRGGYGIVYGPNYPADFGGSMINGYGSFPHFQGPNGFDPAFNIDTGLPPYQLPPVLNPGFFNFTSVGGSYIGKDQGRPAMIQNWSLQVQHEIASDLVATIGYVGQRGTHLRSALQNINNIDPKYFALGNKLFQKAVGNNAGVPLPYPTYPASRLVADALRPFPQYNFIATDCCYQNIGQSTYHSLQATIARRFSAGLNLQASYTWSKDLTDADSALPGINGGIQQIQNPYNLRGEKSLSIQDVPQTFVISYLYELPFGHGKRFLNSSNGFVDRLIGGWQIGGVQRYQSGVPLSFGCATGIPGWDNCVRFDRVPGQSLKSAAAQNGTLNPFSSNRTVNSLFNRAAFFDENASRGPTAPFTLGSFPRVTGELRMNPYYNEDFSLIKNTTITESVRAQLKVELLNAFNRHAFATPNVFPNDPNFGIPTNTINGPRSIQLTGRINF